jgi:putative transposase
MGGRTRNTRWKGTAVSNTYQKTSRRAGAAPRDAEITVPDQVLVSMAEVAGAAKEGLLALAVGTGLAVIAAMFDEDVTRLCGPGGRHNADRAGYRHGTDSGSVTLGGRRVGVTRPRVRAADGSGELHLPSYDLFSSAEILSQLAMEKMLAGLSSRRYGHGLEPAGTQVEQAAASTSKSAVSRRFVTATETALSELMSRRLDDLDLVAFMADGVHFGEHTCVVALGIGIDGTKHPLARQEGSTENATLVTDLITGLRERGLDVTKPILAVIDGSKALARAIKDVFDKAAHPSLPAAQDQKCKGQAAREAAHGGGEADARGLPRRLRRAGRGPADRARPRTRPHPSRCRGLAARGHGRDPHHLAPGRAADPGKNTALHQPDRVHDRDLPGALQERQALAGRDDGPALVRRRDARSRSPVPPRQRPPAPAETPRRRSRSTSKEMSAPQAIMRP